MQNKKTIMTISALFILIFHLWINVTASQIEIYIRQLCVIGVDIFFFIAAYSVSKQDKMDYKDFIVNRFNKIYLRFIIFSLIGAIYFHWSLSRFIKVILGIELFTKGGGSFLWFLPAIMILYITLPLYKKIDSIHPKATFFITTIIYLILSISISIFTSYEAIFIFTNRIPIILIGYYFAKYQVIEYLRMNELRYWSITIITFLIGLIISYWVYITHFKGMWFKDFFYILYIPLIIGIILLIDRVKKHHLVQLISSITLELYAIQMIFGYKLTNIIFLWTKNKIITNILMVIVIIFIAFVIGYLLNLMEKVQHKFKEFIVSMRKNFSLNN